MVLPAAPLVPPKGLPPEISVETSPVPLGLDEARGTDIPTSLNSAAEGQTSDMLALYWNILRAESFES